MRRIVSVWIILLVATGVAQAADAGGFGGYFLGLTWPGLGDLQQRLESHGFQMPNQALIHGGGGYGFGQGWIFGGFGYGGSLTADRSGETVELSVGGGGFEMGRIWRVGPVLAALTGILGGYGTTLTLRPELNDVDFDSLVIHPQRMARMSTGGVLLGLGALVVMPLTSWFSLGLRGHLAFTPMGKWELEDGAELWNAPDPSRWHATVQVMFLFGGWARTPGAHRS